MSTIGQRIGDGIRRMVDRAIGEGTVLAVVKFGKQEFPVEITIVGTVIAEHEPYLAKMIAGMLKPSGSIQVANPEAVRIVKLRGTWQEEILWSGRWHIV